MLEKVKSNYKERKFQREKELSREENKLSWNFRERIEDKLEKIKENSQSQVSRLREKIQENVKDKGVC